jgi:hypothetical protein
MNNLENTCVFFELIDYRAITFLREMLLLEMFHIIYKFILKNKKLIILPLI